MTVAEIKKAVDSGITVHWKSDGYNVIKDKNGEYLIIFTPNQSAIGLTRKDGVTLNGAAEDFYININ